MRIAFIRLRSAALNARRTGFSMTIAAKHVVTRKIHLTFLLLLMWQRIGRELGFNNDSKQKVS